MCLLVSNCIHLAIVMNFVTHCEMVVFYCKAIRTHLEEKSIHLLEAMKQILDLGSSISQLNGAVSRMMSVLIVYFLERTILGAYLPEKMRSDQAAKVPFRYHSAHSQRNQRTAHVRVPSALPRSVAVNSTLLPDRGNGD